MLEHLDLTHPSDAPDQGEDEENEDGEDEDQGEEDQEQGEGDPQAAEMAGETAEGVEEGDADDETRSEQDMGEGEPGEESEEGMMPVRPNRPWTDIPEGFDYKAYRSEEHTSELQSLMRISYAVFCLKKKNKNI